MSTAAPRTGYAPVNGMRMYYEVHGTGDPVVLLHGTFSAIGTSFGLILPHLAAGRQVIAVEFQGHGRTADIDRPLSDQAFAGDVAALLDHLGVERADLFGYSLGASVAFHVARTRPDLVRKLVLAAFTYRAEGLHPGLSDGFGELRPEFLHGTPFHEEYLRLAPRPEDFPALVAKVSDFNRRVRDFTADDVRAIAAPALIAIGDSDIVRPEHAVEMFRLFGGGVAGDQAGLPASRLAILPGTTHVTLVHRAEWLASMVAEFLDAS
ncbi:alpha/beta fold hydrolase [Nonomuraea sp. NPDC050404]|uniref:alpha/beta fold hydrolase n=1 Tax=Nonomuraea sp. NPDC050404 TaxID=3155783 RepID=UPI0033E11E5D